MRSRATVLVAAWLVSWACAAPAPRPGKVVKRVSLPAGAVKWENVKTKEGMVVRVTAGRVVVEGKRLFYGDGKVAMEVVATPEGMHFVQSWGFGGNNETSGVRSVKKGFLIDGPHTDYPGAFWYLDADHLTADKLKPGSVYVITPSVKFECKPRPKPR